MNIENNLYRAWFFQLFKTIQFVFVDKKFEILFQKFQSANIDKNTLSRRFRVQNVEQIFIFIKILNSLLHFFDKDFKSKMCFWIQ